MIIQKKERPSGRSFFAVVLRTALFITVQILSHRVDVYSQQHLYRSASCINVVLLTTGKVELYGYAVTYVGYGIGRGGD